MRHLLGPLVLVSSAAFVAACGSSPSTGSAGTAADTGSGPGLAGDATQTIDRAGVSVSVTWQGPSAGAVFEVKIDNHAIDLASVDLSVATLANDRGERLSGPAWDGGSSGHHRDGTLSFATSSPAFFADAGWILLELPGIGEGSSRELRWELSK